MLFVRIHWSSVLTVWLALALAACGGSVAEDEGPTLFVRHAPDQSGVTFENTLAESPELNIFNYLYYYNGGGVAAGDVNNDGLLDLYFTANEQPNRLYLNRGGFQFEDVTETAGVAGTADWSTGVTMADVNGDGWTDIFVSAVDGYQDLSGTNQLYINNRDGTFTDRAAEYGLAESGYGTQAAFFDYDGDGDLDVYLLRHSTHDEKTYGRTSLRRKYDPEAGDRLLRHDIGPDGGHQFVDVSDEVGIHSGVLGYGLGIAISDLDRDGCPDIYVANDFHENDYLYYCEPPSEPGAAPTYSESITTATGHNSLSSMGTDAADLNNDGLPDIAVLDMLPRQEEILKTSHGPEAYDIYKIKLRYGYHPQFARNVLQLNQGQRRFSDIGYLANMEATDWSWAALMADLDNDARKDLFISNGIYRRPNDLDYIRFASNEAIQGTDKQDRMDGKANRDLMERLPKVPIPNYAFRNTGRLALTSVGDDWGLDQKGFSNGAAYADLDNDGDLDLVTNNINAPASIFENRADSLRDHHYLTVRLRGAAGNTQGIGATVTVRHDSTRQLLEQMPTRGYQSSVDPRLHFGLGGSATVDTLTVVWRDGSMQTLTDVAADQTITLRQSEATGTYRYPSATPTDPLFTDATGALGLDFVHEENDFVDFDREYLMPHKLSTEGPALAVADVNGDGLDDVFAGGAKWQPGRLLVQTASGAFAPRSTATWEADAKREDVDAAFFDADGDGDQDLYVVSAGNEFWGEAEALRDRLYLNDGTGQFTKSAEALPDAMHANGASVAPADFDGDGDIDLFVGSRVVARRYGERPRSYLLENDGTGTFTDVTTTRADGLDRAGMVTDATWADVTGDGRLDLVVVGEWMPVTVFAQEEGQFANRTEAMGLATTNGWWNTIRAADMDDDGDADLIAGNLGRNALMHARPDAPARVYIHDFDDNGSLDQVLTYYKDGTPYPMATVNELRKQIAPLKQQFPTYAAFGARRIDEIFSEEQLDAATVREAHTFATTYFENDGAGAFTARPLPERAQLAPMFDILADDLDGDGQRDLLMGGNFYGVKPTQGRYDASYGHLLRGDGRGAFTAVPPRISNLYLDGEIRVLRWLRGADGARYLLAARNDDRIQVIRVRSDRERLTAQHGE